MKGFIFMHFLQDIAPSYQLSIYVELGESRPVFVQFNLFSNDLVIQNVDGFVLS